MTRLSVSSRRKLSPAEIFLEKSGVRAGNGLVFSERLRLSQPDHIYSGNRLRTGNTLSMGMGLWEG